MIDSKVGKVLGKQVPSLHCRGFYVWLALAYGNVRDPVSPRGVLIRGSEQPTHARDRLLHARKRRDLRKKC